MFSYVWRLGKTRFFRNHNGVHALKPHTPNTLRRSDSDFHPEVFSRRSYFERFISLCHKALTALGVSDPHFQNNSSKSSFLLTPVVAPTYDKKKMVYKPVTCYAKKREMHASPQSFSKTPQKTRVHTHTLAFPDLSKSSTVRHATPRKRVLTTQNQSTSIAF